MRNKSREDQYIEDRLIEWGEWFMKGCDSGIGFPRRNILARIREEGGLLVAGTGAKNLPCNSSAEEVESLVCELSQQQPERANVLRIYYFNPIDPLSKAIHSGYSKSQFYAHLKFAHEWIKGYLSAKKKYF